MHINYKRGETRKTQRYDHGFNWGGLWTWFKRNTNKKFRTMNRQLIREAMAHDDDWEEILFPTLDDADDWWIYD